LALELLDVDQVCAYLQLRCGVDATEPGLASLLHRHTDGNPLFLNVAVDYLEARGWLHAAGGVVKLDVPAQQIEAELPSSLRELVELQLRLLDESETQIVEAASVAGIEFTAQEAAAAAAIADESAESICERLARSHRFVRVAGEDAWP